MLQTLSTAVVALVGVYFLSLGTAALLAPSRAQSFLLGFAGSPSKHYLELAIRFVAGGAFILHGPRMRFPEVFSAMGWILAATTLGLFLFPWRWHEKFAKKSVPTVLPYLKPIGLASLSMGAGLFYALISAPN